jgi:hypothetical protein
MTGGLVRRHRGLWVKEGGRWRWCLSASALCLSVFVSLCTWGKAYIQVGVGNSHLVEGLKCEVPTLGRELWW